jgi:hypothetical protein
VRICGCDLSGSDAVVVVLDGNPSGFEVVSATSKFSLRDAKDTQAVKDLLRLLGSYFREMRIDVIAIKQRAERGRFAGGATTFKVEGLIQAAAEQEVIFLTPQLISRRTKEVDVALPHNLHKYQIGAFQTALVALQEHG